jgi:hypothetical protein
MEPLGDVGHGKSCFGPFGNGVSVRARQVHGLHQMHHRLSNHFGRTRWHYEVTSLKWKLTSVHLERVLILTQDRSIAYAERAIGSAIILDAPYGTPRCRGSCQIFFRSIWRWCYYR